MACCFRRHVFLPAAGLLVDAVAGPVPFDAGSAAKINRAGLFLLLRKTLTMTTTRQSSQSLFPLTRRRASTLATLLGVVAVLTACGDKKQAAATGAPPAPEVGVMTVQPGVVPLTTELPGRLEASRVAEVRARAAGILLKRHFQEGSEVKAEQRLFTIDSAPYRTTYASAQANYAQASALAKRYRPLVEANAVSKQEYDAAEAAATAARAQLDAARIALGYTHVTAPISGRIGREMVTEGALVGQGQPTHLATIQQTDPMYINLTQSAGDVMQLRQALQAGKMSAAAGGEAARVEIILENGQPYEHAGRLLFTDLTVDPATGQVSLRAEVPNPQRLLLPGMYVRVRIQQAQVENAILLPQQAVTRGSQGDTVLVVAPDNSLAPRQIKISQAQDNNWVVVDGLKAGEKVIVDGFTKLRAGMKQVVPVDAGKPRATAPAAIPASASSAQVSMAASAAQPSSLPSVSAEPASVAASVAQSASAAASQ